MYQSWLSLKPGVPLPRSGGGRRVTAPTVMIGSRTGSHSDIPELNCRSTQYVTTQPAADQIANSVEYLKIRSLRFLDELSNGQQISVSTPEYHS
eukprot:g15115.t1